MGERPESRLKRQHVALALELADRVVVLKRVEIVLQGTRDELRSSDRLTAYLAGEGVRPASAVAVERHPGG